MPCAHRRSEKPAANSLYCLKPLRGAIVWSFILFGKKKKKKSSLAPLKHRRWLTAHRGMMLYKVKHVCPRNMDNALIMYDLYSMWNAVRDKNAIF